MVFAPFRCENRYRFCSFWSWIGSGFRGNYRSVWTYLSFQLQMNQKERVISEFEMDFKKSFCLSFTLKRWLHFYIYTRSETGMDLRDRVWKHVWKIAFFSPTSKCQDSENRAAHPHQNFRGVFTRSHLGYGCTKDITFRPLTMIHDCWYALLTISPG